MITVSRSVLAALALGSVVGFGAANRGAAQPALPNSSPFLPIAGAADPASAPGETIEFAAVRTIGQRTEIDLYDTQGKKNHWIPLGGTADGMSVVTYDARRDLVVAKIGGVEKTLKLRQSRGVVAGNAAVVASPAMSFATPPPPPASNSIPNSSPPAAAPVTDASASSAPVAPTAPAATPAAPAAPLSIARQEEEARMLVSDLLEIGMAQRKAYEEKQKQAADPNAAPQPPPAAAPHDTPDGG